MNGFKQFRECQPEESNGEEELKLEAKELEEIEIKKEAVIEIEVEEEKMENDE